jgi:hypothetical protein
VTDRKGGQPGQVNICAQPCIWTFTMSKCRTMRKRIHEREEEQNGSSSMVFAWGCVESSTSSEADPTKHF